jgi:hypothetical protein
MLSPQHWAQATNDLRGTLCVTYGDCFLLKWDKKRFRKTIPISPSTTKNVGIMASAVGNNNHLNYCSILESETPAIAFKSTIDFNTQAAVVSESDNEDQHIEQATISVTQVKSSDNKSSEGDRTRPLLVTFENELDKLGNHPTFDDSIKEKMHWHYRLNHASFPTMLHMAKLKHLPQGISLILRRMERHHHKPPLCSDCIASKMSRKHWRQKKEKEREIKPRTKLLPGDVVSVDQLVSSTPGLVACLHGGYPTKEKYIGSTVFVDQAPDFSYIYHHTSLNSAQTVQAKQAFEAEAKRHGVTIKHYHADNRLFRTKPFEQDIEKKGQILSYKEKPPLYSSMPK